MKIAIVGATGQLGRDVLRAVEGHPEHRAVVLDRTRIDLDDPDAIPSALAAVDFEVLINCAGYTAVDRAEEEPGAAFRRNAYAVQPLALGCEDAGARLVHVSTDYVFDGEASRPYRPDDAPAPINVYGASKLVGEALARRAHPGALVVRTSSVFGPVAGRPEGGNFVETILRLSRERDRLSVVAEGAMTPTYTADLAAALLGLIDAGAEPGIYHATNSGHASWHAFAREIVAAAGRETPVDRASAADYPRPARRPRYSVLDTAKTEAYVPALPPWQDALRRYLAER